MRILIVDDSPNKCNWIMRILEEKGYDYDFTKNLEEALSKVKNNNHSYDGIILDRQFPKTKNSKAVDGAWKEFLEELKKKKLEIPVLGNSTTLHFPGSDQYSFFKEILPGLETMDATNLLLEFLKNLRRQS